MRPISRRGLLVLGGVGAVAIVAGGAGIVWTATRRDPAIGPMLHQPEVLASAQGLLEVRLRAAPAGVEIGGTTVAALTYNGGLPGPTLAVRPGDLVRVVLENGLSTPTNLHTHGLHVSPQGAGDNPFVEIPPGETFDYEYRLPPNHPPGVYWYHPHHHGAAADQVFGGLYGAILVTDAADAADAGSAAVERVMIISDIAFDGRGVLTAASPMDRMVGREGDQVLVNGQLMPRMSAASGAVERWRVINACTSRYLRLRLDGQRVQLLGTDSGRFAAPHDIDEVRLVPGGRADLLVTATAGDSVLRTLPVDRGSVGGMMGGNSNASVGADLATFGVSGATANAASPVRSGPVPRDLRSAPLDGRRLLTLATGPAGMAAGMMSFTIDGKAFDPNRVDTAVTAGAIEEWTLRNTSPMDHPFHLHVWPMQVVDDGQAGEPVWLEVVNVPAGRDVRVRIAFDDFTGRSVYHCHILDHEDNGMMGVVEVS